MRAETPHGREQQAGDRRRYWCHESEAVISDNLRHVDELGKQRKLSKSHPLILPFPPGESGMQSQGKC
jgi:hypothetical protein